MEIKGDRDLQIAALSIIKNMYQHAGIVKSFTEYLGHEEYHCSDIDSDHAESNARANEILCNAGLLDHNLIDKANKPHWLYGNMIIDHDGIVDNIKSSSLYRMLETYPAGTMLEDISGYFWVRRAQAAITRHRFITDDQENYYMQKYLLSISVSPNDDIVAHPPSSWIKVAMSANLVDQHHDVRANLMDAVKRGFNFENIRSLVKMYLENEFLDEEEADAFLSTLPVGTDSKGELGRLQTNCLVMVKGMIYYCLLKLNHLINILVLSNEMQLTQILAAIIGAAGCGKSYVMGAIVTYLKTYDLIVTKLAPSGVAASLIKGTTIHIFFKLDITI